MLTICELLPVLLLCAAAVDGGVEHGLANCWFGCGAHTGILLLMVAVVGAAAAAAVGMQRDGGANQITAAARAALAVDMPVVLLLAASVLGSKALVLCFAACTGTEVRRINTESLLARATGCAERQPDAALLLVLLCSCAMLVHFMLHAIAIQRCFTAIPLLILACDVCTAAYLRAGHSLLVSSGVSRLRAFWDEIC
jgi:hypothetical protein